MAITKEQLIAHMPSIDSPGFTSWADDWHGITLEDGIEVEEE